MSNSKPLSFFGQLNFTQIKAELKSGHVKAQKIQTKNGEEIVFDINVWVHEEADQYNNNASVQLSLKKEAFEGGVKNTFYIGNLKYKVPMATEATAADLQKNIGDEDDDLPF